MWPNSEHFQWNKMLDKLNRFQWIEMLISCIVFTQLLCDVSKFVKAINALY